MSLKKLVFVCFLVALFIQNVFADEARLLRYPDIHGDKVVFMYGCDLWVVNSEGGTARRITSHPGEERYPKFSPDGKWISFTAEYDGNPDIYKIPSEGGEPTRLTYHPDRDQNIDWHPDGKSLIFRGRRASFWTKFRRLSIIPVNGGYAETLPLPTAEQASYSPDGKKIAYNRVMREFKNWKRYRGGLTPNIWIYDFESNSIVSITDHDANDMFPMWNGDSIYYISDRNDQMVMNLYVYNTLDGTHTQLTNYKDYDIKWPAIGPDAIVYEYAGYIYKFDTASNTASKLSISLQSDNVLQRPSIESVGDYILSSGVGPTGACAVFESRGELFTVPARDGKTKNITNTMGVRERAPAWSPDGKWIAYASDKSGEYEIYLKQSDGEGDEVQLTHDSKIWYQELKWSPDGKKLLVSDCAVNLFMLDVDSKQLKKIDHGDYQGASNFLHGVWSPDSNWIAYNKKSENHFDSIYIYSLEQDQSFKVTGDMTDDEMPTFDPDGKYLYFVANRQINFDWNAYEQDYYLYNPGTVALITLKKDAVSPIQKPEPDAEYVAPEEVAVEEKSDEGFGIDLDGMEDRIVGLSVSDTTITSLTAVSGGFVYTAKNVAGSGSSGETAYYYELAAGSEDKIVDGLEAIEVSANGKKLLFKTRRSYGIVKVAADQNARSGELDTRSMRMELNPIAEYKQMYVDAWRIARDFFYDPNMHGVDWGAIREKYWPLVACCAHRDDFNYVLSEMMSELAVSHAYVGGYEDFPSVKRVGIGLLGCELSADTNSGKFAISKIYQGNQWDPAKRGPLTQPGLNIAEGDYLVSIDGQVLTTSNNPYALLLDKSREWVEIGISKAGDLDKINYYSVKTIGDYEERMLRYRDWVNERRAFVEKLSNGKVGYIHVPATSREGIEFFSRDFYPQVRKEALIIDIRFNSGGYLPDIYFNRLNRKFMGAYATRYSDGGITPFAAHYGPKVCVINHYAGSGGDQFAYAFRQLGLGKLVGTRTWGGLVGTSDVPMLSDNGKVEVPDYAFYNEKGEWDIENIGIAPDIEVDDRPDLVIAGHDPSLEKAVEVALQEIEMKKGQSLPKKPTVYPVR